MNDRTVDQISYAMAGGLSRRQLLRLLGGGATAGALAVAGLGTTQQASAQLSFPISGSDGASFLEGTFAVSEFAIQQGTVVAIGELVGTVTGAVTGTVSGLLTLPVLGGQSDDDCEILNLVLGPLDLSLLGLNVFLDTVTLIITATPGGGLLGDLLCAISGLLSGPGNALGRLRNLLNELLGALLGA